MINILNKKHYTKKEIIDYQQYLDEVYLKFNQYSRIGSYFAKKIDNGIYLEIQDERYHIYMDCDPFNVTQETKMIVMTVVTTESRLLYYSLNVMRQDNLKDFFIQNSSLTMLNFIEWNQLFEDINKKIQKNDLIKKVAKL